MKIGMVECDWKADLDPARVNGVCQEVGSNCHQQAFDQDSVDSKVLFISSEPLTEEQMKELFVAGDLTVADEVWEGETFQEIVKKVVAHAKAIFGDDDDSD